MRINNITKQLRYALFVMATEGYTPEQIDNRVKKFHKEFDEFKRLASTKRYPKDLPIDLCHFKEAIMLEEKINNTN